MSSVRNINDMLGSPSLQNVKINYITDTYTYCDGQNPSQVDHIEIVVRCRTTYENSWFDKTHRVNRDGQEDYPFFSKVSGILSIMQSVYQQGARDRGQKIRALIND